MKSKQELIEEWESAIEAAEFYGKGKEERLISYMRDFVDDLNQLDEPDEREQLETAYKDILSRREFLFDDKRYVVVEKPTIPKFVADWYESEGKHSSWWNWFYKWGRDESRTELESKAIRWMQDFNEELFVDMFRYGCEVAEEQKYIISININDKASKTNYETFLNKRGIFHSMENDSFNSEEFNWTEEEIRGLTKGGILFEHFAVKVEELEE